MPMIKGVHVQHMTGTEEMDYRDDNTLWFWPNGYGNAPAFELTKADIQDMLEGFNQ